MTDSSCATGRTRYADRITAALAQSRTVCGARGGTGPSAYRCSDCGGWHLPLVLPTQRARASERSTGVPALL